METTKTLDDDFISQIPLRNKEWWDSRRKKYNIGLVKAGVTAFFLYSILGSLLISPHDNEFEITLFTIFFQGIGYLFMMGIANIFYSLGHLIDKSFNKDNNISYRLRLFNLGYWFSFALPFSIPLLIIIVYFIRFALDLYVNGRSITHNRVGGLANG